MKQIALIIYALFYFAVSCPAQDIPVASNDTLLQYLPLAKEDTSKVLLLIKIGNAYERNKPDSAIYYYKAAGALSKKIHYLLGEFKYLSNYTAVLNFQNKFEESLGLNLQSAAIATALKDNRRLAMAYNNVAASYYGISDFENCIQYFLKAADILEKLKDTQSLCLLYGNLGGTYNEIQQPDKAYAYGLKSIELARMTNDRYSLENGLTNTGSTLMSMKKYDSALIVMQQALALSKELNDQWTAAASLVTIGGIYSKTSQYNLLLPTAEAALAAATSINEKESTSRALLLKASYFTHLKKYAVARPFAEEALGIARASKLNDVVEKAYLYLSDIELGLGNITAYHRYRNLNDSLSNAILSGKIIKNTQELDARYSLTKKQTEIESLNKEKEASDLIIHQRNTINLVLAGLLVFIAAAGGLFYRYLQQKRKLLLSNAILQQQRITELESEKRLLAADAVLQGQEEERSRLARELHDGLGGILSSAKYSFNNMKNNYIITKESADAFDRSMAMLDKSISELRIVSHNMMPEALMEFGLDTALRDYCNSINQAGSVALTYQSFEVNDDTISKTTASVVYRIVQELVNNILKHAGASTALVQLIKKENGLSITVEDDGRGFDKTSLQQSDGIGLKNLQHRVAYLNGVFDITAGAGKGVSINIEVPYIV